MTLAASCMSTSEMQGVDTPRLASERNPSPEEKDRIVAPATGGILKEFQHFAMPGTGNICFPVAACAQTESHPKALGPVNEKENC